MSGKDAGELPKMERLLKAMPNLILETDHYGATVELLEAAQLDAQDAVEKATRGMWERLEAIRKQVISLPPRVPGSWAEVNDWLIELRELVQP